MKDKSGNILVNKYDNSYNYIYETTFYANAIKPAIIIDLNKANLLKEKEDVTTAGTKDNYFVFESIS